MDNILAILAKENNRNLEEYHKEKVDQYEYWLRTQFSNPKQFYSYAEDMEYIKNIEQLPIYERTKISIFNAFNKANYSMKTNDQIAKICNTLDDCVKYYISVFQQKTIVYNLNQFLNDHI